MSVADELAKLAQLRDSGALTAEEYERAKARVLGEPGAAPFAAGAATASSPFAAEPVLRLRRSRRDCWLGGVCGGLGHYTGVEGWVWRLIFLLSFFFAGIGILPYLLLWILVPADDGI